jgi:hypothetical protein
MQVDKEELLLHHNIHFYTHMEVYERSSSSALGGEASDSPALCQVIGLLLPFFDLLPMPKSVMT